MSFRVSATVLFLAFGGVVACTTFNGLTAEGALDVPNPNGKNSGADCEVDSDCKSNSCSAGKCTAVAGANPDNAKKDGDESDVDCGGSSAPACEDGKSCNGSDDCASASCISGTCKAPAPDDNIKNADETDVDCGGTAAPKCASGKTCGADSDCQIGGCNYQKKCVDFPSCVGHEGGDTCGAGETGAAGANHESCCTTVQDGNIAIGKYYVTAGRMRAFVKKYDGNLQKWANEDAKNWNASLTSELPASMDDALQLLGPGNKRGCSASQAGKGGRTYWQPPLPDFRPDEKNDFDQKVLDEKILNCVPWVMASAICAFDGGRLATAAELLDQITNHGTTKFPWGNTPNYQPKGQIAQLNHFFSYQTPNPPANLRNDGTNPIDKSFFMSPPGRFPLGENNIKVQDALGASLAWTSDGKNQFAYTASWEEHNFMGFDGQKLGPTTWPSAGADDADQVRGGYYAIGARCVFDK